jgi:hypothetical protein
MAAVSRINGTYPLLLPAHDHGLLQTSGLMSIQPKRPHHQNPALFIILTEISFGIAVTCSAAINLTI